MNSDQSRKILIAVIIVLVIGFIGFILIKPESRGTYYTTSQGNELFTDPDQTREGNTTDFYSLLNIEALSEKYEPSLLEAMRTKIEAYLLSLPEKPKAVFYVEGSAKDIGSGLNEARFTTVDPYYSLQVIFTTSTNPEVEIK